MQSLHWLGVVLWRGGLLFAAAAALFEAARSILRFVDIPPQLEAGFGCIIAGMILVIVSLILERLRDQRIEGDLRQ